MDAPNMHFLYECISIIITHKDFTVLRCSDFCWPGPVGLARGATMKNNNDASQYKF